VTRHTTTRRSLHGIAEGLLAGPQYQVSGTIRLRVEDDGFSTVAEPSLRVRAGDLELADGRRVPLRGTFADVAVAAGLAFTVPTIYRDHAPVGPSDPVVVDPDAARALLDWFLRGRTALQAVAPTATPVLWPEHFDLSVVVDEVTVGVSPGDGWREEPYGYAAPWDLATVSADDRRGFWDAPFGAALPASAVTDVTALARFYDEALARVRRARATR
jgi:hypothetical protein